MEAATPVVDKNRNQEDMMSVLMELEKPSANKPVVQVDSSDDEAAARSLDPIAPVANTLHALDYSKKSF